MTINHARRGLLQGLALSTLAAGLPLGLGGCASPGATPPAASPAPRPRSYTETIRSVLVSEDGHHVVAIGSRHHYVFDAPAPLVRSLGSSVHPWVTAVFSPFRVDSQAHITGEVTLRLADDTPADALRDAQALGFARDADGKWQLAARLAGQRYAGWTYEVGVQRDKLNRAYTIEVESDESAVARIVDDAATPIRIAADGIQLLYVAPLAPIIVPMIFLLSARDH